eukprot:TRINITY_DN27236_c0_g1_i3.p1 TRINITY_DN27236_c0_g1~~TRINITY_DN27236_c0_g1_i3.p1  ORF type:complete len:1032 (-),score=261.95 TRINITY_DN27236_c0_g1_i3:154-2910(-)
MHVATSKEPLLIRATDLTYVWSKTVGASLNAGKSMIYGDTEVKLPNGKCTPNTKDLALLGSHVERTQHRGEAAKMEEKRLEELKWRLEQIRKLPLARRRKLELIAQAAIPVLFSWEYVSIPGDEVQRLRRSVWEAARGGRQLSTLYVLEVLFTIAAPGHRLDPAQVGDYRTLSTLAGLRHLDAKSQEVLSRQWTNKADEVRGAEKPPWGPTRRLAETLESVEWQWEAPRKLKTHKGTIYELPVSADEKQKYLHEARSALRRREMLDTQAAKRKTKHAKPRTDLAGVQEGVVWEKNRVALESLNPYDAASVIQIMAGAQMTRDRAYRHKRWDITNTPTCPTCGVEETREHTLWTCSRWQYLRPAWFRRMEERKEQYQPCLRWCGIATKKYRGPEIWHVQRIFTTIEKARRLYDPFPQGARRKYQIPQPHPPKPPEDGGDRGPPKDQADEEPERSYEDYDSEEDKGKKAGRKGRGKNGGDKAKPKGEEGAKGQQKGKRKEDQQQDQRRPQTEERAEEGSRREDFLRRRRKQKAKGWDEGSTDQEEAKITWEEENEAWQDNYDAYRRPEWQRRAAADYEPSRLRRMPKAKDQQGPKAKEKAKIAQKRREEPEAAEEQEQTEAAPTEEDIQSAKVLARHPHSEVTIEDDKTTCRRCGKYFRHSWRGRSKIFWEQECHPKKGTGSTARGAGVAMAWFTKDKGLRTALPKVRQLEASHGNDLKWSWERWGPISCGTCRQKALFIFLACSGEERQEVRALTQPCRGDDSERKEEEEKLRKWAEDYRKRNREAPGKHDYRVEEGCLGSLWEGLNCGSLPRPTCRQAQDWQRRGFDEEERAKIIRGEKLQDYPEPEPQTGGASTDWKKRKVVWKGRTEEQRKQNREAARKKYQEKKKQKEKEERARRREKKAKAKPKTAAKASASRK